MGQSWPFLLVKFVVTGTSPFGRMAPGRICGQFPIGFCCFWLAPGGRLVDVAVCRIVLACPRQLGWSQPVRDLVVRDRCAGRLPEKRM